MIATYGNREKQNIFLVPLYVNIDCVNNFPLRSEPASSRNKTKIVRHINGVHPAKEGYWQIADSFYFWMKYRLGQ